MSNTSFKDRVKNVVINEARTYKKNFVDYEYLICSDAFLIKDYYIIDATVNNYQHLTGVHTLLSPQEFFDKCYNGTLKEIDFDFIKQGQNEPSVKGTVRRKIYSLPHMMNLFNNELLVEETFVKNQIICTFATSDKNCTLGFIDNLKSRPMSLIKGNELDLSKAKRVNLLLRKETGKDKFDEILIGDTETLIQYYDKIKTYVDDSLISQEFYKVSQEAASTKE